MITFSNCVKNRRVIISLSICFKNFLTTNGVVDVKQISNNSGMNSAKHERTPHISSGEIISESKHLKDQLGPCVRDVTFFGPKEVSWIPLSVT